MGQRILVSCDGCGYKEEMSVGSGLMSRNPEVAASCLQGEEEAEWRRLNRGQKIEFFRARQKVFYCEHCNALSCQLAVDVTLKDKREVTFGDRCGKCGNRLEEISLESGHMLCPVCKEGVLSWRQTGLWD